MRICLEGLMVSVALGALVSAGTPACAQAVGELPQTAAPTPDTGLADIIVMGRKRARAEELQKTPVAITALSTAELQQANVKTLVDVGRMTPSASLQSSSQRGVQNFTIRGMGISGTTISDEPTVGIFQDGIYRGSNFGALGDLVDLEGVEILRGPQGTLFGRNVTGGAVTLRSARPDQKPFAKIMLGVGNGMMIEGSAVVNGPLIEDTLAARIAVQGRENDGNFYNTVSRTSWGQTGTYVVRPSLKWTPNNDLQITTLGEYYRLRGDPQVVRAIAPNTVPGGPLTLAERAGYRSPDSFFSVSPNVAGYTNVDIYFAMVEATWKVGPGTLTSISGYRNVRSNTLYDADGAPVDGFVQFVGNKQHQWSTELTYAADFTDWLSGTVGLYYFDQKIRYSEYRDLNNHATLTATRSNLDNDSVAAFAEFDIKPFEGFEITLGGRYTHETKQAEAAPFGQCTFDLMTCNFSVSSPYKGNNFSPKIGLSYQIDPNKLVYASVTKGYRSGGFSLRGTPLGAPYRPEKVTAYEAGFKSDWFDRHLRFNASLYYNKYDDLQRTVLGVDPILGVVQSVFNAADATIKGAEIELRVVPVYDLTLSFIYGYTGPKYKTFLGFPNPGSLEFVRVPKNTGNVALDYRLPLDNGDHIDFHAAANYTSRYYFNDANTLMQKPYTLVDANIVYNFTSGMTVSVYGRNLTQTKYAVWGSTLGALGQNIFPGDPRTYGVRLTAQF